MSNAAQEKRRKSLDVEEDEIEREAQRMRRRGDEAEGGGGGEVSESSYFLLGLSLGRGLLPRSVGNGR